MDKIIRCITSDGAVMASAIDASDIVFKAQKIHGLSRSATAALGRLLCATSMMGAMLKQKDASINLRVSGDGELGPVIAVADSKGNVRGYVGNANCPTEYYNNGKINVSKAVGKNGVLNVMRDYGSGDPYIGQVELVSGEIAEDLTYYFAVSEQTPSSVGLGVLMNKDNTVRQAGGFIIQLMPDASEETISALEKRLAKVSSVTAMLDSGKTPEDILQELLGDMELAVLHRIAVSFKCGCSKERFARGIASIKKSDIQEMIDAGENIETCCQFCNSKYVFTPDELKEMM